MPDRVCKPCRRVEDRERYAERKLARKAIAIATPGPTDAQPGTDAKIAVLSARQSAGLPLFHPSDRVHPYLWTDVVRYVSRM